MTKYVSISSFFCSFVPNLKNDMKNRFILAYFLLGITLFNYAQAPATYYNTAEGKKESTLKTALYDIIKGHTDKGYDGLYEIYKTSDNTAAGKVWDMYSTCDWTHGAKKCGSYKNVCDCYNREHSIPQSWFSSSKPMVSDAFHVYPTDGKVNGQRSNNPFGECNNGNTLSNKALGRSGSSTFPGFSGTVFEPVDEYKGDFARTYFYFATRYEDRISSFGGASFNGSKYPALSAWTINLFLKWHRQDPVSQKEIDRNNAVYAHQKNRNPFIDHPELAEYIWGDKKNIAWTQQASTEPQITAPAFNSTLDFGNIPYQTNSVIIVDFMAANLTGDVSLSLSGTNKDYFSLPNSTISKSVAEAGTKLTISCNPQVIGLVTATLNISGGGLQSDHTILLKANSLDSFLALAATDVSTNSFKANWTPSTNATNYLLDVFYLEHSGSAPQTILDEGFTSGIPSDWKQEGYFNSTEQTGAVRLASGNTNGVLTTPTLDLSETTELTIRAKQYSNDTGATIEVTVDNEAPGIITTTKDYQNFIVTLPAATETSVIKFSVQKGKRVYIDDIKLTTEGEIESPVSVSGYPKQVGITTQYTVEGLEENTTYFYTIQPQGNNASISDAIRVITSDNAESGVTFDEIPELIVYFSNNTLYFSNTEIGSKIVFYNLLGVKIREIDVTKDQMSVPVDYKGIFIIQTESENQVLGKRKMVLH